MGINNKKLLISNFDFATDVVSGIRTIRKNKNIAFKEAIELSIINNENATKDLDTVIQKLTNASAIHYVADKVKDAASFRVKSNEYFVPISLDNVDVEIQRYYDIT